MLHIPVPEKSRPNRLVGRVRGTARMATFNLRKFTDPSWLQSISAPRMIAFLSRWRAYLATRGFDLADTGAIEIDYPALSKALLAADATTPTEMIDALYYVHESSDPEDQEELQAKATAKDLKIVHDPTATPADYAVDVWSVDPDLLREAHAETLARRQQSFQYHGGKSSKGRRFPHIPDSRRRAMESALDDWFDQHRRGRGCRLLVFIHRPIVWILVRHGRPMRREASHGDDGTSKTEFYRPQQHDILIYDEQADEIGVHAETVGERKLYLRVLGQHLFGDADYFPQVPKYTLAPLVEHGRGALACADVEGIDEVRLIEYRKYWGGEFKESEIRRAEDIFGALEKRAGDHKVTGQLSAAAFKIRFADSPRERRLVIRAPASARYERDTDSTLVESWLRARGFILSRFSDLDDDDEDGPGVLEGA